MVGYNVPRVDCSVEFPCELDANTDAVLLHLSEKVFLLIGFKVVFCSDQVDRDFIAFRHRFVDGFKQIHHVLGLKEIEEIHKGMICSVLRLRGDRLYNWSAPNLPERYLTAIEGAQIGHNKGSCGTAAFLKEKVVVVDIENDPRWVDYKEFALLEYLLSQPGRIITKDQIMQHVWNYDSDILPNTVEVYIGYLRTPLDKPFEDKPNLINTRRGFGYYFGEKPA